MQNIDMTTISFPGITLRMRDGHKLRGFFTNMFKDHSALLHNHEANGKCCYRYPLVQYKVLRGLPMLIGLGAGAHILEDLYDKIDHLNIQGIIYPVSQKMIDTRKVSAGLTECLHRYQFQTLWMALNQENFLRFSTKDKATRQRMLIKILTGNILNFLRAFQVFADREVLAMPQVSDRKTQFKDTRMLAFNGGFAANVLLPEGIGLGKSVARGFGTVSAGREYNRLSDLVGTN